MSEIPGWIIRISELRRVKPERVGGLANSPPFVASLPQAASKCLNARLGPACRVVWEGPRGPGAIRATVTICLVIQRQNQCDLDMKTEQIANKVLLNKELRSSWRASSKANGTFNWAIIEIIAQTLYQPLLFRAQLFDQNISPT